MKGIQMVVIISAAIVGLTGCSTANTNKTVVSIQHTGQSDSSNESRQGNTSITFASRTHDQQSRRTQASIFEEKTHRNTYLSMSREVAEQLMQATHVGATTVAMTDTNIYVAVDLGEVQAKHVQLGDKPINPMKEAVSEVEQVASSKGDLMDWVSATPLSSESSNTIRQLLTRIYPDSNIFISTNPRFVSQMKYFDKQQRKNKRMDTFLNEFNSMVQKAFYTGT